MYLRKYSKQLLLPCFLIVLLSLLGMYLENLLFTYLVIVIHFFVATIVGYRAMLLDDREKLARCAILASMVGVARLLVVLPKVALTSWGTEHDYEIALIAFFVVSSIAISFDALLGMLGGKLCLRMKLK
jgi:hypothetical protein